MIRKLTILIIFFVYGLRCYCQHDTLKANGILNVQGIFQTGNFNQIGGNATSEIRIANSKWSNETYATYTYFNAEGSILNDLWTHLVSKYNYSKRLYPTTMVYYGFATSFGITNSIAPGMGLGVNIIPYKSKKYLNAHVLVGYFSISFNVNAPVNVPVVLTYVKSSTPLIKNKLNLYWEFDSFHAVQGGNVNGVQNSLRLGFPITKYIEITLSNLLIYSSVIDLDKKPLNTLSLVGITGKI